MINRDLKLSDNSMLNHNPDLEKCGDTQCEICKTNKPFELPEQLVDSCNRGELIIFAGAGISTEGKNVFPSSFYQNIKSELEIPENENVSFSKLMSLYCSSPRSRKDLLLEIKDRIDYVKSFPELYNEATKFHRELSTIPHIHEIFTTNWDDFFERESDATPIVTSEDYSIFQEISGRKVFKLHGSIYNYGSIIATEEDYKKCYTRLNTGIIGAKLKTHFLSKVMVFVGFSFDDEDFQKLYKLLSREVKGLLPHFYVVTLDEKANEKLASLKIKAIPIITNGTFFLKKLKEKLIEETQMIPDDNFYGLEEILDKINIEHNRVSNIDLRKHPDVVYSLMYQDGLLHSFQYLLNNRHSGLSSNPARGINVIESYDVIIKAHLHNRNYLDAAYFTGYQMGQIYFLLPQKVRDPLPLYYLYGYKNDIFNFKQFTKIEKKIPLLHKSAHKLALKAVSEIKSSNMVFHRRPFL